MIAVTWIRDQRRSSRHIVVVGVAVLVMSALFDGILVRLLENTPVRLMWRDALLGLVLAITLAVPEARRRASDVPWKPLLAWGLVGLMSLALSDVPLTTGVRGLRATFMWVLLLYVASAWLGERHLRTGLTVLVPVLVLVVGFAAWQSVVGKEVLLDLGYEYAVNVREAAGRVRAFGTFVYDAPFAHSMGVLSVAYLALLLHGEERRLRWVAAGGVGLALVGMVLALNRTAVLSTVLAGIVMVGSRARLTRWEWRRWAPWIAVVAAMAIGLLAVRGGAFFLDVADPDTPSVADRLRVWPTLLEVDQPIVGDGPGSVGAVPFTEDVRAGAPVAEATEHVTDNYYLAAYAQYGALGVGALVVFLVLLWRRLTRRSQPTEATWVVDAGRGVLVFIAIAMVVVNLWDDFPTPLFAWIVVGAAAHVTADTSRGAPQATER